MIDEIAWRQYGTVDAANDLLRANRGLAGRGVRLAAGTLVGLLRDDPPPRQAIESPFGP